eukprot:465038-Prymnesium_polylepis.1
MGRQWPERIVLGQRVPRDRGLHVPGQAALCRQGRVGAHGGDAAAACDWQALRALGGHHHHLRAVDDNPANRCDARLVPGGGGRSEDAARLQ